MLSIPSAFGLSILARPLLLSMTTSKFVSDGVYIIPLVVVGIVFWGMGQIFMVSLLIFKRRRIFVLAAVIGAVTNVVLNIIFVPKFGVITAAITTLMSYIIIMFILGYSSRRHFTFDLNFRFIVKCIFASVVMMFAIWIFNPNDILGIVISIVIGIIIYFCLLFLQKVFKAGELRTIFDIVGLKKLYEKIDVSFDRMRK
jgi:O-antigen/teichoic acid export membrane protein